MEDDIEGNPPLSPISDLVLSFKQLLKNVSGDTETLTVFDEILTAEIETASANGSTTSIEEQKLKDDVIEQTPEKSDSVSMFHTPPSVQTNAEERKSHLPPGLVTHIHGFIPKDTATKGFEDLENMFNTKARYTKYMWLSKLESPYKFGKQVLFPEQLLKHKFMTTLLDFVNTSLGLDLDCCLVTRYTKAVDSISYHQDDEQLFDQTSPMCNISFGASREIKFAEDRHGKNAVSYILHSGSLLKMNPGCQSTLWHSVSPGKQTETRYCASFRKILQHPMRARLLDNTGVLTTPKRPPSLSSTLINNTPARHNTLEESLPLSCSNGFSPFSPTEPEMSTKTRLHSHPKHLVIGDSMVKGLDVPDAVIIAQGGGHPADMIPLLQKSADRLHPEDYMDIETVTICVGTNSLNVTHNRFIPMSDIIFDYNKLIIDIKNLFPNAKVGLFNVMPRTCNSATYWRINDFNMFIRDHVAPHFSDTYWIRLYNVFITPYNRQLKKELYGRGLLHLSPLGKGLMRNAIVCFQYGMRNVHGY